MGLGRGLRIWVAGFFRRFGSRILRGFARQRRAECAFLCLVWCLGGFGAGDQTSVWRLVACRSEFVTADTAGGVGVFPLDGPSIGGVGVDGASEFASQVGDRGEDAARNDLAFDLGEPDLDLVEPGRVSGRE